MAKPKPPPAPPTGKVFLAVDLVGCETRAERDAAAIKVLKTALERLERGLLHANYHGPGDGGLGKLVLGNFRWSEVGLSRAEPTKLDLELMVGKKRDG
jgi:hypothetical protein